MTTEPSSAEASSSTGTDFKSVIAQIAFQISVMRAKSLAQTLDFAAQTPDIFPDIEGLHSVFCILTGKALRLTFRICVHESTARAIVASMLGKSFEEVTPESGFDYVKEVANMVSGGIQKHLYDQGISLGIGIPLVVTAGTNLPSIFKKTSFDYAWLVSSGECHLNCALGINSSQDDLFQHLVVPDFNAAPASEDIEFF